MTHLQSIFMRMMMKRKRYDHHACWCQPGGLLVTTKQPNWPLSSNLESSRNTDDEETRPSWCWIRKRKQEAKCLMQLIGELWSPLHELPIKQRQLVTEGGWWLKLPGAKTQAIRFYLSHIIKKDLRFRYKCKCDIWKRYLSKCEIGSRGESLLRMTGIGSSTMVSCSPLEVYQSFGWRLLLDQGIYYY